MSQDTHPADQPTLCLRGKGGVLWGCYYRSSLAATDEGVFLSPPSAS